MNLDEAIKILNKYSPMPDDENLNQQIVDEYKSAIDFLDENPNVSVIKPLIYSLGAYDGWGIYEVARSIIVSFKSEQVIPIIEKTITSDLRGRRYWSTLLVVDFPDKRLIPLVLQRLKDDEEEIRMNAVMALESIGDPSVINELVKRIRIETDEEILETMEEVIETLQSV